MPTLLDKPIEDYTDHEAALYNELERLIEPLLIERRVLYRENKTGTARYRFVSRMLAGLREESEELRLMIDCRDHMDGADLGGFIARCPSRRRS